MFVVVGCDDQYTESECGVKEDECIGLMMSGTDRVVLSSNVMTK